jgi:single-strand DNA-binding protein
MSRSINRVELLGRLGQDAETSVTQTGMACTKFSLATSRRWKDKQSGEWKEATDWHRCVLWNSEKLANYLRKGRQVYCEGRLQTHHWEDHGTSRYVTEVVLSDVILLANAEQAHPEESQTGVVADANRVNNDDVPL